MPTITTKGNLEGRSSRRMGPGIHPKCVFVEGSIATTANGKELLELWFQNVNKETQKKAIFFPTGNPPLKEGENLDQAKEREMNAFTGSCLDVLLGFYTTEESEISAENVKAFAKKVLDKLNAAKGKFCNLMVQYTQDYKFTEFPRFDWIEKHVEGSPSTLRINDNLRLTKKGAAAPKDAPQTGGPFF